MASRSDVRRKARSGAMGLGLALVALSVIAPGAVAASAKTGRFVAFTSLAGDIVGGDCDAAPDIL